MVGDAALRGGHAAGGLLHPPPSHVVTATSNESGRSSTSCLRRRRSAGSPVCSRTTRICGARRGRARAVGSRARGVRRQRRWRLGQPAVLRPRGHALLPAPTHPPTDPPTHSLAHLRAELGKLRQPGGQHAQRHHHQVRALRGRAGSGRTHHRLPALKQQLQARPSGVRAAGRAAALPPPEPASPSPPTCTRRSILR